MTGCSYIGRYGPCGGIAVGRLAFPGARPLCGPHLVEALRHAPGVLGSVVGRIDRLTFEVEVLDPFPVPA